jgi:hypothetical protein
VSELHLEYIGTIHRTKQKDYFFNRFIHELGGMIQINQTRPRCLGQEESTPIIHYTQMRGWAWANACDN